MGIPGQRDQRFRYRDQLSVIPELTVTFTEILSRCRFWEYGQILVEVAHRNGEPEVRRKRKSLYESIP